MLPKLVDLTLSHYKRIKCRSRHFILNIKIVIFATIQCKNKQIICL